MNENNNVYNNNKGEEKLKREVSYDPKKLEDSYFGGKIVFKTKVVWRNVIFFALLHLAAFYGFWLCISEMPQFKFRRFIYAYCFGWLGGEGVTIGAHRLWTHRSYKARRPLRIILIIMQTIAGQNCCHTWVRDHRIHHKYSDTDADPHNSNRGFFFCHMGWLMMKKHPECKEKEKLVFLEDVERDPVIMFQKKHFKSMFLVFGMIIPVLIPCILWGETFWNSVFISLFYRYVLSLNIAWTVNSIAHFYGNKPYDRNIRPTENGLVSFLTYGEGWHNYHHAFPWDYKASEYGMKLNFTRSAIEFFERIGWAYDLKEGSTDMVEKRIKRLGDGTHHSSLADAIKHDGLKAEDETGW